MDRETLGLILAEILRENTSLTLDSLDDSLDFREHLALDSIDFITMLCELESRLEISIPTREMSSLQTVGDLIDLIEARVGAKPLAA